jgi:hypothetical protein
MTRSLPFKTALLTATLALSTLAMAQTNAFTKADYATGKARIDTELKADTTACASLKDNAKDICVEEAKAKDKVARADLEFSYTGKPADATKARVVKAETAFDVAKERCDDSAGNAKDVCVKQAHATKVKAVAEAKLAKQVKDARSDAAADISDANYKVAVEKCDAMAGDAKSACLTAAKSKFGKS